MTRICAVYDNGGETAGRYTIILDQFSGQYYACLGLSDNPTHPQGFSQFGTCIPGEHLGKKITMADLPDKVAIHALGRHTR